MTETAPEHPLFKKVRLTSGTRFAAYGLGDSIALAKAIHEKGGGRASHDQLAAFLGYSSTNNGAFLDRMASAKTFGLVTGGRHELMITTRAQQILMPEYPEQVRGHLIEAFMEVPLFKAVYEEYHGKELPPEFGLKNALRTRFAITPSRINDAYRSLMESADMAGLFEVRGSRTQLIIPAMPAVAARRPPTDEEESAEETAAADNGGSGGSGGSGGGRRTPSSLPRSKEDLQNEYVGTLIGLLRDKGSQGEVDEQLMAKIEKLLDLQ